MKSVLITGTSRGIGLESALAFGRAGYTVHATMRNPLQSPQLSQLAAEQNLPIHISTMDVDSDESVRETVAAIETRYGPIDVLVNNAGMAVYGAVEEGPFAHYREAMETNYFGALRCIQAVVKQMRQRRSGCIINVTSVAGRIACAPLTPYMASKFALEALSEALAGEMKPFGVRVAIVEPGIIDTVMAHHIENAPEISAYPQQARFARLFAAVLKNPEPPTVVADKILEIAETGTWQLRHPVGQTAVPFLQWRNAMSDEEWVTLNASDDETWYECIQRNFGLDARPEDAAAVAQGQLAGSL